MPNFETENAIDMVLDGEWSVDDMSEYLGITTEQAEDMIMDAEDDLDDEEV